MVKTSQPEKKTPVVPVPEKKPFVALPPNPFVNINSQFNKSGFKGKSGGGHPVIRKHAARSR